VNGAGGAPCLPAGLSIAALVVMCDELRPDAANTFEFFADEGVELKVISGDDPLTVSSIAAAAGIAGAERYVDMSRAGIDNDSLVANYTVFGRASPRQKKELVAAMKRGGHTVCMTGDGVNDVPAMKEADCSIAMRSGSSAARGVSDFVLMGSDFSVMKGILFEGRKVINNIETVAALYLIKTIYSTILSLMYIFIPTPYPFIPLQVTPINVFTVGIPSFLLTLRGSFKKPAGMFATNILIYSLPAALTIVVNIIVMHIYGRVLAVDPYELSAMRILITGAAGFYALYRLARPRGGQILMFYALAAAFIAALLAFRPFIGIEMLTLRSAALTLPMLPLIPAMFFAVGKLAASAAALLRSIGLRRK
jgi:cation-transporting ATPase E